MYSNKSVSVHECHDFQSRGGGYFLPLLAYELDLNVKRKEKSKKQIVWYFRRKVGISMMKKEKNPWSRMSLRMYVLRDIIGKGGGKVPLTPPPYMLYANYKDMKNYIRKGIDMQL